jgi:hypothetical protein
MSCLVTGLFYERGEAERAVDALKAEGFPGEDIYLETEVAPSSDIGWKGGEVGRLEQERRFAGLETGVVIGLTVGVLAGMAMGFLGSAMGDWTYAVEGSRAGISPLLANPALAALCGALIGLITGALIGWVVDYTLNRMGAGPPLPAHETLVTLRADEHKLDQAYAALLRARARHLHVAGGAPV